MRLSVLVAVIEIISATFAISLTRNGGSVAYCPGERVVFECTVNANLLEWSIDPHLQHSMARTFRYSFSLTFVYELSWSGLSSTVVLTYTSRNSTSMTSTAEVTASSEFHEARFSCSGLVEASQLLLVAGHLTFISNLTFMINESTSHQVSIHLNWNEPFMDITRSGNYVDSYLLDVNGMTINTTEPSIDVVLTNTTTDFDVELSAENCYGFTPKTVFHLSLLRAIVSGTAEIQPGDNITEPTPPCSDGNHQSTTAWQVSDARVYCLNNRVAVILGSSAVSSIITITFCFFCNILTHRRAKKKYSRHAINSQPRHPIYEEINTISVVNKPIFTKDNDKIFSIEDNDAYKS